ncbi:MAG: hypothetical protein JWR83_2929 [Aeromicrobium sp.]|nr:hypothetical protein [Aeromicrobium sp.]
MSNSHHERSWSAIYKLTSEPRQQRILRAIDRIDHPGITALGTTRDGEFLIVAKCTSAVADVRIRRIVMSLDLLSERISPADDLYEPGPPSSAYASALDLPRRLAKRLPVDRIRKIL